MTDPRTLLADTITTPVGPCREPIATSWPHGVPYDQHQAGKGHRT